MDNELKLFYRKMIPQIKNVKYEKKILKKGSVHGKGALPLPCDMIFEKDVAVPMRDGVRLYTDIFRPVDEKPAPVIIAWSPYGKTFHGMPVEGIALSNLQKFEAPDPAYWIEKGYIILNIDTRGVCNSEGEYAHWSKQMGRDGADTCEWAASQEWSNGKVGFAGNSYLAITQWFIAAERPTHLAAIAPWEGFYDAYHQSLVPGGIPDIGMEQMVESLMKGRGKMVSLSKTLKNNPHMNTYWEDYRAEVEKIITPAYVVSSYANKVHVRGTIEAYERISSKEKWLRIHNTHEWKDFYTNQDDLKKFFDYYLKGEQNGWENTPRVRMSVLNPGGEDIVGRPEEEYPLKRTVWKKLFLDSASGCIGEKHSDVISKVSYMSDDNKGHADFVYTFDKYTEFVGNIHVKLWVAAETANDMDIFVMGEKLSSSGEVLPVMVKGAPYCKGNEPSPFEWGNGRCRVSARISDREDHWVNPGEIIPIEMDFCPMGMLFEPGQKLRISIYGFNPQKVELPMQRPIKTINQGRHIIYSGKEFDSYIELPITKGL